MPKTNPASAKNGLLGGRPKGSTRSPAQRAVQYELQKARLSLAERCQQFELDYVKEIEWIARNSSSDTARLAAYSMLLDRGRGKAVAHTDHAVTGNVIHVITGVPEPDPDNEIVTLEHEPDNLIAADCGGEAADGMASLASDTKKTQLNHSLDTQVNEIPHHQRKWYGGK